MSSESILKPFQKDTAARIKMAFASQSAFALADEVGLGKTLTCAEVAYDRILESDRKSKNAHIVFYVAPSIELIEQNLKAIQSYLLKRFNGDRDIFMYTSRLTKVASDMASKKSELKKTPVHLIGLSPATSFNIRGAGLIGERALLSAFFGFNKSQQTKVQIAKKFWCLDRKLDERFASEINYYSNNETLQALAHIKQSPEFDGWYQKILNGAGKIDRELIGSIRKFVAQKWVEKADSVLVVLDEWHKYKQTCFDADNLMRPFLDRARGGQKTKLLLVSATPFTVRYNDDDDEDVHLDGSEDLKGLMQLFWGEDAFEPHYEKIKSYQQAYLKAAEVFLNAADKKSAMELESSRAQYERLLRKFCVRTERMRISAKNRESHEDIIQDWSTEVGASLSSFLETFSHTKNVRSPIISMWQDGHTFPQFEDYTVAKLKRKSIAGEHWKVDYLKKRLNLQYPLKDIHSFQRAPLWLYPNCPVKKILIFSEFQFITNEVCNQVPMGSIKKSKGMIDRIKLGYFPMRFAIGRRARTIQQIQMNSNFHWLAFYPALSFENAKSVTNYSHADTLLRLGAFEGDAVSNNPDLTLRKKIRFELFDDKYKAVVSKASARYFDMAFKQKEMKTVGRVIVDALRESGVFSHLSFMTASEKIQNFKKFEKSLMNLSNSFLHLFSSDEALKLNKQAKQKRLIPKSLANLNEYVAFSIWYAKEYKLEETLKEFASNLLQNNKNPIEIVNEIAASVNLRKSALGTRFVRAFNDRKIDDYQNKDAAVDRKSLRVAFNSPFPPYVLVTTSVGQEGLDFHRYCASIIHWSPPGSPNSLKQREGRLDRYRSLQNRIALQKLGLSYPIHDQKDRGLSPDFVVVDSDNKRINYADSVVLYLPFTAQEKKWHRCLERSYYNDLLIGAPDPLASEQRLQRVLDGLSAKERAARLEAIQRFSISLRPK